MLKSPEDQYGLWNVTECVICPMKYWILKSLLLQESKIDTF